MLATSKMLFFMLVAVGFIGIYAQDNLTVNTTQGSIIGQIVSRDGMSYTAFYGVPYAANVDGVNRFRAPQPPLPSPGPFHAHNPDIICAQPTANGMIGQENCLTLNILTTNTTGNRPVMVFLMGEQYTTGNYSHLNFDRFVTIEEILVVTINYRLSVFGFLCLGIDEAPGNAGLKDVIAGLRWVRDNINSFGGDSNNVMLVGHGSGAAMVDLVNLSPLGNGLIHKAIAQSGSSLAPWAVSYNPKESAKALGQILDVVNVDDQELALRIRNASIEVLQSALTSFGNTFNTSIIFSPCIENPHLTNEPFITRHPLSIIRSGDYDQIPFILGYTNAEGTIRANEAAHGDWFSRMEENFANFIPVDLNLDVENSTDVIQRIREFYFANQIIRDVTVQDYINFHGDINILISTIRAAVERSNSSRAEVRLYEFGYIGTWGGNWPYPTIPLIGAPHGHELNYLLNTGTAFEGNVIDIHVRDSLIRRWAAFARTDIPVAIGNPGNVEWLPTTNIVVRQLEFIEITESAINEITRSNPHQQLMGFWNKIYEQYYVPPQPVSSANNSLGYAFLIFVCSFLIKLV